MKIRNGFVSNSSGSSFLIYGANITDLPSKHAYTSEVVDLLISAFKYKKQKKINKFLKSKCEENIKVLNEIKNSEDFERLEDFFEDDETYDIICSYSDLIYFNVMGEKYIGESPDNANDNITFGQWKENVMNKIKQIFPFIKDEKINWVEECWYD
ncbi:MAG: hypothetical protein ACOCP4_04750 [Candidatus Woesearchaeota archaeon]